MRAGRSLPGKCASPTALSENAATTLSLVNPLSVRWHLTVFLPIAKVPGLAIRIAGRGAPRGNNDAELSPASEYHRSAKLPIRLYGKLLGAHTWLRHPSDPGTHSYAVIDELGDRDERMVQDPFQAIQLERLEPYTAVQNR